ncbi:sigma-54 dependent transcriptional regulator [Burkholderia pyrrocinia]|uniref:sigma-54 interaction domain-containing protein n=1 Tax=Burkholderia pyrrocinia TaxID=60550 RepID=UPI0030D3531D
MLASSGGASHAPVLVGASAAMERLRIDIGKVARIDANVLIIGETGTGKECVAESIHCASSRARFPLVRVNCAALPDTLIESELFGYDRGAFTGAQQPYPGKVRLADHGTVFLDEIGELSPCAQAKLLRLLESHEVFPLGGRSVVKVDVRFIAATNSELELLVEARAFRRDLYYRLNVAMLCLPPLKERRDDLVELFAHHVREFNRRYDAQVGAPSADLVACMRAYHWPGNVRELRNLVESIFIDPPVGTVGVEHLREPFRRLFAAYSRSGDGERERLIAILQETNWNKSKAAEKLSWSRMTLYRKLSKYALDDHLPHKA